MTTLNDTTVALILSGFTPAQADAISDTARRTAAFVVDELRQDMLSWHCHLALYVLAQIGVALLAILLAQAAFEPVPTGWSGKADTSVSAQIDDLTRGRSSSTPAYATPSRRYPNQR